MCKGVDCYSKAALLMLLFLLLIMFNILAYSNTVNLSFSKLDRAGDNAYKKKRDLYSAVVVVSTWK